MSYYNIIRHDSKKWGEKIHGYDSFLFGSSRTNEIKSLKKTPRNNQLSVDQKRQTNGEATWQGVAKYSIYGRLYERS